MSPPPSAAAGGVDESSTVIGSASGKGAFGVSPPTTTARGALPSSPAAAAAPKDFSRDFSASFFTPPTEGFSGGSSTSPSRAALSSTVEIGSSTCMASSFDPAIDFSTGVEAEAWAPTLALVGVDVTFPTSSIVMSVDSSRPTTGCATSSFPPSVGKFTSFAASSFGCGGASEPTSVPAPALARSSPSKPPSPPPRMLNGAPPTLSPTSTPIFGNTRMGTLR
mmetsp:Transcript_17846/g.37278  ORF Transcript_17846/g.37278 Transcript_17846/m.37278 type:complete len:222 (-) Transcript_17846:1699-2364(-)